MKRTRKSLLSTIVRLAAACLIQLSQAAPTVFTIDSSQSQVAASGTVIGGVLTPQGAGALSTSYSGIFNADVTGSTIQFTGGSTIIAQNSGSWQPDEDSLPGTAPANYGAKANVTYIIPITFYGALRNIVLDLTSPEISIIGGGFPASNLVFSSTSPAAVLDYYSTVISGSVALNGYATNAIATQATLTSSGSTQTLVIPIDATFRFKLLSANDTTVRLTGQLVATSSAAAPPIIHFIAVTNQTVTVTAENSTEQSQLLVSTNLTAWLPASATTTTNNLGWIIFTTPLNGPKAFYRVEQ